MKASTILTPTFIAGACALGLAACGSSPTATGSTAPATTGAGAQANGGGGSGARGLGSGQGRGVPGADGLIAAVSGSTLQVQSRTQQVAVVVNAGTKITQQVRASATDITVGSCVVAMPARTQGQATGAPTDANGTGGASGATPTQPTAVAAATVQVSKATNGSCTTGRGFGGPGAGIPSGAPTDGFPGGGTPPSGAPTGFGTRGPGGDGRFGGFGGAIGIVASVGSGTFTVTVQGRPSTDGSTSAPTTVTVTYTGSTAFTTTKSATTAAIKVGECARATGSQDDTGTVTATSLALSSAVDGQCTEGFGGRRG